jgi:hypothetical protein
MIRPSPEVVKALAVTVRQYPAVLEFLRDWRMHELEQLPQALANSALSQGRCQVLGELYKLVNESPDMAANPSRSPSSFI